MTLSHILGMLGYIAVCIALIVLAHLSQRLGHVTHARPYYMGHYLAAGLIGLGVAIRLFFIIQGADALLDPSIEVLYTVLTDGLPAVGVTVGLVVTWYYWSWLLAERD